MNTCGICESLVDKGMEPSAATEQHERFERYKAEQEELYNRPGRRGVSAGGRPMTHAEIILRTAETKH